MDKIIFITFNIFVAITIICAIYISIDNEEYVSKCCKSEYRETLRKDKDDYYCLNCKRWCDLIEK